MVSLTRIYTKSGDKGKTSLGSGQRVLKSSARIEAIGTVDEANATLGLCRLYADATLDDLLSHIQNDLFDAGADLCVPENGEEPQSKLTMTQDQTDFLERTIDYFNKDLAPLNSFILPGGSALSSHLHLARTVVRRAERSVCSLHEDAPINGEVIRYLNRLSDLLFVLGRTANDYGKKDVLWVPGENRHDLRKG